MPTMLKGHHYVNKNKKSKYISEITPLDDIEVPKQMFADFEDVTNKKEKDDR